MPGAGSNISIRGGVLLGKGGTGPAILTAKGSMSGTTNGAELFFALNSSAPLFVLFVPLFVRGIDNAGNYNKINSPGEKMLNALGL